ncbi:MAG: hypothetical protein QF554_08405 [Dehalococcoidia bacterium]|jgi:hypothetical protein|nr:hypothetical protein [Dehalococcoidia bacterium]
MGKFLALVVVLGVIGFAAYGFSTDWEFARGEERTTQELALDRFRGFTGDSSYDQVERFVDDASYAIEGLDLEQLERFADDASYAIEGLARDHVDQFTNDASEAINSFLGW